ncbi:MAG TPA: ABC transporter, partial [Tissierellaceae bacterium]|nr:ABC transporter [Tissierellaceae bacterium]
YLDINSLEVVEELLLNYNGTILLVSHDRKLIENVAEELLIIKNKKIRNFKGTYKEYLKDKVKPKLNMKEKEIEEKIILLKNQISSLLGQISIEENQENKKELDKRYKLKLEELENLKKDI